MASTEVHLVALVGKINDILACFAACYQFKSEQCAALYIHSVLRVRQACFVKIILLKTDNCALALRKRLFCNAKPTLLPCKTAAFGTQNNRFCNALTVRWLCDRCACEKYLHLSYLFSTYIIRCAVAIMQRTKRLLLIGKLKPYAYSCCLLATLL